MVFPFWPNVLAYYNNLVVQVYTFSYKVISISIWYIHIVQSDPIDKSGNQSINQETNWNQKIEIRQPIDKSGNQSMDILYCGYYTFVIASDLITTFISPQTLLPAMLVFEQYSAIPNRMKLISKFLIVWTYG